MGEVWAGQGRLAWERDFLFQAISKIVQTIEFFRCSFVTYCMNNIGGLLYS